MFSAIFENHAVYEMWKNTLEPKVINDMLHGHCRLDI